MGLGVLASLYSPLYNSFWLDSWRRSLVSSFHSLVVAGTKDLAKDDVLVFGIVSFKARVLRKSLVVCESLVSGMMSLI